MDAGLVKGEGFAVDASVIEADASRYHGVTPEEADWSASGRQTRAVAEFLGALGDDDPTADRKPPKVISLSDPCSAWTAKANKRVQFGYGLNYLIDVENAVIVDVEATPARTYDEVAAARTMIERTERMGFKPRRLAADTAYGTGKFLGWLVGAGIAPQIPVWDKSTREDGTFSRSDFTFDRERNVYVCPAGKVLKTTGNVGDDHMLRYLASKRDCDPWTIRQLRDHRRRKTFSANTGHVRLAGSYESPTYTSVIRFVWNVTSLMDRAKSLPSSRYSPLWMSSTYRE
jgi:hypothetical protein